MARIRTRDPMARDLRTPKYRTQTVEAKRDKEERRQGRFAKHKKVVVEKC